MTHTDQLCLPRRLPLMATVLLLCIAGANSAAAQPSLTVGQEIAPPGSAVSVPVTFASDGTVVALQFDLSFDSSRVTLLEPLLEGAAVDHLLAFGTPTEDSLRVVVYSPTKTPLQTGQLLSVPFAVAADAIAGVVPLDLSAVVMGNASSTSVPPTQINNGSIQVENVPLVAQLSLTKTADQSIVAPGDPITYTIVATNAGPRFAEGAGVVDIFPTSLASCSWVCAPSAGATCAGSTIGGNGIGDLIDTVDLAAGASVTYTATCTFAPPPGTDVVINTATITVPDPLTDPDLSNNDSSRTTLSAVTYVFVDGFESGDVSVWSGSAGRPTSIIELPPGIDEHTESLVAIPAPLALLGTQSRSVLVGLSAEGVPILRLEVRNSDRGLEMRLHARADNELWETTSWQPVASHWQSLDLHWRRAWDDSYTDGEILISINGRLRLWLSGLDNDRQGLDRLLLFDIAGHEVLRARR